MGSAKYSALASGFCPLLASLMYSRPQLSHLPYSLYHTPPPLHLLPAVHIVEDRRKQCEGGVQLHQLRH